MPVDRPTVRGDYGFDADSDADSDAETLRFTAQVLTGNLRLLIGNVRANRPWRLAAGLSRALAAAAAVGASALVTSDIWRLSDALGWSRLLAVSVGSLAALAVTLLVVPGLFGDALGHRAGDADHVELAWLTSSSATVGGALGAELETDEAVREAAYAHRLSEVTEGDLG